MHFFQQLFDQLDGIDLNLTIKRKNGKMTVMVLPQTLATISPAIITGTPDELQEGFFEAIKAPLTTAKGLNVELANLEASIKTAKKTKEADLKKVTAPEEKPSKKPEKKVDAKKAAEVKETPKKETLKIEAPDLFAGV